MEFLEKDLESIIWESDIEMLEERGLTIEGKMFRQLRIGNYGIADLVTVNRRYKYENYVDGKLTITVYELKKGKVGISAFLQALRYCKGIAQYLDKRKFYDYTLAITLIGKSVDLDGSLIFISDLVGGYSDKGDLNGYIDDISFYSYDYKIDGLNFELHKGYKLTNEGF